MSRVLPILFNTEMVRAILDGRKTVTRRICKDGNIYTVPDMDFYDADKRTYAVHNYADKEHRVQLSTAERSCPICPGDILYVRETWCLRYDREKYFYKADKNTPREEKRLIDYDVVFWKPSIHMPKEAARIWLKVTDVRVERLQEITEHEAEKEGFCDDAEYCMGNTARGHFAELWNSIIKNSDLCRYGWEANSYVFVIEFERCEPKNWKGDERVAKKEESQIHNLFCKGQKHQRIMGRLRNQPGKAHTDQGHDTFW